MPLDNTSGIGGFDGPGRADRSGSPEDLSAFRDARDARNSSADGGPEIPHAPPPNHIPTSPAPDASYLPGSGQHRGRSYTSFSDYRPTSSMYGDDDNYSMFGDDTSGDRYDHNDDVPQAGARRYRPFPGPHGDPSDFASKHMTTMADNDIYNDQHRIIKLEQQRANLNHKMAEMIPH